MSVWAEKAKETKENMNIVIEEKSKLILENKTIKEHVAGLEERVRQNFGLQHQQI